MIKPTRSASPPTAFQAPIQHFFFCLWHKNTVLGGLKRQMTSRPVYGSGYGERPGASVEKTFWDQTISLHPWRGQRDRWPASSTLRLAAPVRDRTPPAHPLPAQATDTHSTAGMATRQRTPLRLWLHMTRGWYVAGNIGHLHV